MKTFNQNRVTINLKLIAQLKAGQVTREDLKSYTGWGGLKTAFYEPTTYSQLKTVLTQEELASMKYTLSNAYYTPISLVKFIYDYLSCHGFNSGRILEPSVGNGIFVEHMPASWRETCDVEAVELDSITAQITQQLYPDIRLHYTPFEKFQPTQKYDLIIGNPPYGSTIVNDQNHTDISRYCIHHYFVAKSMRLLNDDGIAAMVLPSYFLDNETQHVRHIIQREGGSLLAAYRLPDDLFSDAKVTIDLVFLQKKKSSVAFNWANVKPINVAGYTKSMNAYFHANSHHILGNLEIIDMYKRKGLTCKSRGSLDSLLAVELERLQNYKQVQAMQALLKQKEILQRIEQQTSELAALKANVLAWKAG